MSNKIVRLGADYFDGGWLLSNPDLNIAPNLLFLWRPDHRGIAAKLPNVAPSDTAACWTEEIVCLG